VKIDDKSVERVLPTATGETVACAFGATARNLARRYRDQAVFREYDAVVFTFAFPIVLLLIFGLVFHGEVPHTGVGVCQELCVSSSA